MFQIPPTPEEQGFVAKAYIDEIGDTSVVVFTQDSTENAISTIIIRGSTDNIMDDIERAVDDGVNNFKALTRVHSHTGSYIFFSRLNSVLSFFLLL